MIILVRKNTGSSQITGEAEILIGDTPCDEIPQKSQSCAESLEGPSRASRLLSMIKGWINQRMMVASTAATEEILYSKKIRLMAEQGLPKTALNMAHW